MTRQAKLQGSQLVLESKGKEGVLRRVVHAGACREPAGLRAPPGAEASQKALDARLVYDRAPGAQ